MNIESLQNERARLSLQLEEGLDVAEALDKVEQQLFELKRSGERKAAASRARESRDRERKAQARADAIEGMKKMLAGMDKKFEAELERLLAERHPGADEVRGLYVLGRQAYALSHDLFAVTEERRYWRSWTLPARLEAFKVPDLFIPNAPKPRIPKPWDKLLKIARGIEESASPVAPEDL